MIRPLFLSQLGRACRSPWNNYTAQIISCAAISKTFPAPALTRTVFSPKKPPRSKSNQGKQEAEAFLNDANVTAKFDKALDHFKLEVAKIKSSSASPAILDRVKVTKDNQTVALTDIAGITIKDANTLMVSVADTELVMLAKNAIVAANLGLNPVVNGNNLRIPIPKPSTESRALLTKKVTQIASKAKDTIRDVKTKVKKSTKNTTLSNDAVLDIDSQMKLLGDKYIAQIDKICKSKSEDLKLA